MLFYRNCIKIALALILVVTNNSSFASNALKESVIKVEVAAQIAAEPTLPKNKITIEVDSDVVKLSGIVDTSIQAEKAIELAMSVEGVKDVDNSNLKLTTDKNVLQSLVLTAKAKGKIKHLAVRSIISSNYNIQVETKNNHVYLKGTVGQPEDKFTIIEHIRKIKDVEAVTFDISDF
jgi:osmotically-inducible protein OsmY